MKTFHEHARANLPVSRWRLVTLGFLFFTGLTTVFSTFSAFAGWLPLDEMDLSATPFASWEIPMLILAVVVGGGNLVAARAVLLHHPAAAILAALGGAWIFGFVFCEVMWLGIESFLQPFYLAIGLLTMTTALVWRREGGPT